jgi:hypothetical protein
MGRQMGHTRRRAAHPRRGRRDRHGLLAFVLGGMALAVLAMAIVSRDWVLSRGADAVEAGHPSQPAPGLALRPAAAPAPMGLPAPVPRSTTTAPSVPHQEVARAAEPPTPPPTVAGSGAGITPGAVFEGKFVSMTSSAQQAVISQMKGAGVGWLRLDVPSDYRFDTFVRDATSNGIQVDAVLQAWNTTLDPSAFAGFATQAVHRLEPLGVKTYEILNEPNCDQYCMPATSYTRILQASYTAVKAVDPTATVLTAGLGTGSGSNEPYNYLTAMYQVGAEGYFDAFNVHPYSFPDTPSQTADDWNPWSYLSQLHEIMAANGDGNKKIWLTEFGCPTGAAAGYRATCNDSSLAAQITDAFDQARGRGWVGPLFVYDWQDEPSTPGGDDFGLYYADGTPKAMSLAAFERAAQG